MAKKQGIDNIFKEVLSKFELSEKGGNWGLLNHLLNEQERKKKNRKLLVFIVGFVFMLSIGLLALLYVKELNKNTNTILEQSNTSGSSENNAFTNTPDKSTLTTPSNDSNIEKEVSSKVQQSIVEEKEVSSNVQLSKIEDNPTAFKDNNAVNNGPGYNVANQSSMARKIISEQSLMINSEKSVTDPEPAQPIVDPENQVTPENKTGESMVTDHSQVSDSVEVIATLPATTTQNSIYSDSFISKSANNDSSGVFAKSILSTDSLISEEQIQPELNFRHVNVYAGITFYSTSHLFTNQQNISPLAGVEYVYPLTSKLHAGLAVWYSLQGGYDLRDTVTKESYFLDRRVSQQSIQIQQLHKLYFPLTLYYAIGKKHSALGAIQVSYLLNTNGNFSEINTSSEGTRESHKNNVKGYMDGIKSTNLAFSFGYKYRISRRFDVSMRITRELTESYIKEYFYGVTTKPSWSFQTLLNVKF